MTWSMKARSVSAHKIIIELIKQEENVRTARVDGEKR